MSNQQFHFYATNAFGWATSSESVYHAIAKLAKDTGKANIKKAAGGDRGCYFWTCRVHVPADADYRIEFYQPKGVATSHAQEWDVWHAEDGLLSISEVFNEKVAK